MGRASAYTKPQIGVEVTPGTEVPANKQLVGVSLRMKPVVPTDVWSPSGNRFPTDVLPQKQMAEARFDGRINLGGDLVYFLSSIMHVAAVAGTWTFKPSPDSAPTIQTYTLERGSAQGASQAVHAVCNDLEMRWTRTEASLSGRMFGKNYDPTITITPTPTKLTKALALPGKVKVEVGDSIGGLTKLTRCLEASWAMRNAHAALFTMDEAEDSFVDVNPRKPDMDARLVVENNSTAQGLISDLMTSDQKFARITSYGPPLVADPANRYRVQVTFPFKFQDADEDEDGDGAVETGVFDLQPLDETAYGGAIEIVVTNNMATL